LRGTKEWIDLIVDQCDAGIEVTSGEQEFIVNCNWKLISENQIDSYHGHLAALELFSVTR
jgi:p-cumate 2,3-dioxygenase alpha subunit